ncbi:hypothetical protein PS710_04377 [Pseudomonas fluorescens]|uniref:Uncharacterized protein n=1 Tax=Pseudomonas fluorescens TaxID=294 RepID=A0A5E7E824_PSEFL|nr:hypothetical protein PS710_04377 [Pseudomonas fluorescens]
MGDAWLEAAFASKPAPTRGSALSTIHLCTGDHVGAGAGCDLLIFSDLESDEDQDQKIAAFGSSCTDRIRPVVIWHNLQHQAGTFKSTPNAWANAFTSGLRTVL